MRGLNPDFFQLENLNKILCKFYGAILPLACKKCRCVNLSASVAIFLHQWQGKIAIFANVTLTTQIKTAAIFRFLPIQTPRRGHA